MNKGSYNYDYLLTVHSDAKRVIAGKFYWDAISKRSSDLGTVIEFSRLFYCFKLKKIYMLYENFICTGLPSVLLPDYFILTLIASTTPVLYPPWLLLVLW